MTKDLTKDALTIFQAGLEAANPEKAVEKALEKRGGGVFSVAGRTLDLDHFDRIFVVGAGKAASPMVRALEKALPRITDGAAVTKYGHVLDLETVQVMEAGHPTPDAAGAAGSERILALLEQAAERDLVFCVLSGGGSALLPLPSQGLTLEHKQDATKVLLACGAPIHEINAIRKHISRIKGGQLARAAWPATLVTLVLSDVIGDDLDAIASGPTVPDSTTFAHCLDIVERHRIREKIPPEVLAHLEKGAAGNIPETPKEGDPAFAQSLTVIVGSSRQSLFAAREKARSLGYGAMILSSVIEGETREAAGMHTAILKEILATRNPLGRPACVLSGGETTVTLRGDGLGGRNMEFALAAAPGIAGAEDVLVFSAGTDGTDGPTDAAGAWCDGQTLARAKALGMEARDFLERNDSYRFFQALDNLVITGPTMTNVMDLRILLAG